MHRGRLNATLCAAAVSILTTCGDVAAQTIRHEANGQTYTYDFKQRPATASHEGQPVAAAGAPRKPRAAASGMPRGSKNIPWDEPGKIDGVPGVLENSATSLPVSRAARTKNPSDTKRARAEAPVAPGDAQTKTGEHAPNEPLPRRVGAGGETQFQWGQAGEANRPAPTQGPRPATSKDVAAAEEAAKVRGDEAEVRARIIAEAKARAMAEEQRRLEIERSKDRHARRLEPPAAGNATANPAMASAAQADPASTGAIAASRRASDVIPVSDSLPSEALLSKTAAPAEPDASAARSRSTWKNGVCKILFFGILPGC